MAFLCDCFSCFLFPPPPSQWFRANWNNGIYFISCQGCFAYTCEQAWKKTGKTGSSLPGNFVIGRGKNREIHKGNHPILEGNLPCWREILPSLQGNKHFCQACLWKYFLSIYKHILHQQLMKMCKPSKWTSRGQVRMIWHVGNCIPHCISAHMTMWTGYWEWLVDKYLIPDFWQVQWVAWMIFL